MALEDELVTGNKAEVPIGGADEMKRIVGGNIRKYRVRSGKSLMQVAAPVRISFSHLSDIEKGKFSTTLEHIISIATALNTTVAALCEGILVQKKDKETKPRTAREIIGKRLLEARKKEGLTLKEIGTMTGYKFGHLSQMELGKHASFLVYIHVAQALRVDLQDLFGGIDANGEVPTTPPPPTRALGEGPFSSI